MMSTLWKSISFRATLFLFQKVSGFVMLELIVDSLGKKNEAKYAFAYTKIPQVALGMFALNSCIAKGAVAFVILIKKTS